MSQQLSQPDDQLRHTAAEQRLARLRAAEREQHQLSPAELEYLDRTSTAEFCARYRSRHSHAPV